MDIECIFNKIYNYYNKTDENLKNMSIDLEKLNNTHLFYIKSINEENANTYINSNNFHYSVYIDDIFYQKKILTMEYECMLNINNFNIDKFYRDLYKLYLKIIKLLVNVIHENNKLVTKINDIDNIKNNVESIEDIRKKFLSDIKIYKESDSINQKFNYDDIKKIFNAINKRNTNINEYIKDIHKHILIVDKKVNKGMLIETFKISFNGNIESLVLEYNLYIKIFESIITNHYNISKKYYIRTKNISDEITFDEDNNSNKTIDNSSESTPNNKNKNINNIIDIDTNSNADSNADNNIDINHEFKISFNKN
jgi:hypothetical protein